MVAGASFRETPSPSSMCWCRTGGRALSRTVGLVDRRPVRAAGLLCIGKEPHHLEERSLVSDPNDQLSIHADCRQAPWATDALPGPRALAAEPDGLAALAEASRLKGRALRGVLAGRSRPRRVAREELTALLDRTPAPIPHACPGCGAPLPS